MTLDPDAVRELTIAGAGAIVLPSLPICAERFAIDGAPAVTRLGQGRLRSEGDLCSADLYHEGSEQYLSMVSALKRHTGLPIIVNISGSLEPGWLDFARGLENHGADAIEISLPTESANPSLEPQAVESPLIQAVESLCKAVSIPVSAKLLPFFTSLPNLAQRLAQAGVKGIALFGREPVWQVIEGRMIPSTHWSLSDSSQLQLTLSGLIRLRAGDPKVSVSASGGIATARDVFDVVIAGADVAMVTSEIYRTGPDAIAHILEGIVSHLSRQHTDSFKAFVEQSHAILPPGSQTETGSDAAIATAAASRLR